MGHFVEPKVFLLTETKASTEGVGDFLSELGVPDWHTDSRSDGEMLIEIAGKSCYLSFDTSLNKNLTRTGTRDNETYIQEGIISTKHGSVLEHPTVTFALVHVSRVFTHELVRHRVGTAFSQVSGRYVRTDEINMFYPSVLHKYGEEMRALWSKAQSEMENWIKEMERITDINNIKDFSLKKKLTSAFRRLIGNGQENHIIFSCNHRTLRHVIAMRTAPEAEEEIRIVFGKIFDIVKYRYKGIYADASVEVVDGLPWVKFKHERV